MPTEGIDHPKGLNLFTKTFGHLSEWTIFERIWLALFTLINIALFFAMDDTILGLITSLSGMLCVILVAKGKISNYLFGFIQASLYGYISFGYGLYGETILNWAFYIPVQIIGAILWARAARKMSQAVQGEDIPVKALSARSKILGAAGSAIAITLYAWFLSAIGGKAVGLDSATNVLSVLAQFLMLGRYVEQWLMWIVINVLSIIMWGWVLYSQDGSAITMVVMWSALLVNSIYGYVNWRKMAKSQKVEA